MAALYRNRYLRAFEESEYGQLQKKGLDWCNRMKSDGGHPPRQSKNREAADRISRSVLGPVVLLNAAVYAAWSLLPNSALLSRHFVHSPMSGRAIPLLASVFSHRTIFHLGFNMMALWSFGHIVAPSMGPENFLAGYLSAGALSSFASTAVSVACKCPRPGLGASGAVLAVVAITAVKMPDANFLLLGLVPVQADTALKGLVAVDTIGVVAMACGFHSPLGHAAHLGGTAAGYAFAKLGGAAALQDYQRWVRKSVGGVST